MPAITMNWWAIIVAAVAYVALGAIWYSPPIFGNAWMKGIGKTKEQLAAGFSPLSYVWALGYSFLAAYGIARILFWAQRGTVWDGIVIGLMAGICFALTTLGINDTFERRPCNLTIINVLYYIVGFVIIGIIVGAWH
jgi:hypothetical protein